MNLKLKFKIIEKFGYQVEFAQAVGAHDSLVSRVVKGRQKISKKLQEKWAEALDCQTVEIFSE